METPTTPFKVAGVINVPHNSTWLYDSSGDIRGYALPNGEEKLLLDGIKVLPEGEQA